MQTTMVSIGDTSLAVQICGSGPPLVLLHAFPLDHTMWHRVLPLADHARLIIPDQRGFGCSKRGDPVKPEDSGKPEIASIAQLADVQNFDALKKNRLPSVAFQWVDMLHNMLPFNILKKYRV